MEVTLLPIGGMVQPIIVNVALLNREVIHLAPGSKRKQRTEQSVSPSCLSDPIGSTYRLEFIRSINWIEKKNGRNLS